MKMKGKSTMTWLIVALWSPRSLPKSLCSYFWVSVFTLIFAIIFAPILLIIRLIPRLNEDIIDERNESLHDSNYGNFITPFLIYIIIYAASALVILSGHGILETMFGYDLHHTILHYIYAFFTGLISYLSLLGIIILLGISFTYITKRSKYKIYKISNTTLGKYIKAKKNKICPIIEYEE